MGSELIDRGITGHELGGFRELVGIVLRVLERELQKAALFVAHLDKDENELRIIDTRGDESFGLAAGGSIPLDGSFCVRMAAGIAPRLTNDAAADAIYREAQARTDLEIQSYLGVPLQLDDGTPVASLCAIAHTAGSFTERDLMLIEDMSRILELELAREAREQQMVETNDALRRAASQDHLTRIFNRRAFDAGLRREWQRCRRGSSVAALVVGDVAHFKQVNDTYGHTVGDDVLRHVAGVMVDEARGGDWCARIGGDEFAAVLAGSALTESAYAYCDRVNARLAQLDPPVRVSFGVSMLTVAPSPEEALEAADSDMYERREAYRASQGTAASTR